MIWKYLVSAILVFNLFGGYMIGDILEKMASEQKLNPVEVQKLKVWGNQAERYDAYTRSLIGGGRDTVRTGKIDAITGVFEFVPTNGVYFAMTTPLTNSNDTLTEVQFTAFSEATPFLSNDADPARVNIVRSSGVYVIVGSMQWATNGTGRRAMHVNFFDADDNSLGGDTMASMPPTGVAQDTIPFMTAVYVSSIGSTISYMTFTSLQTSGGNLDLEYVRMAIFAIK